MSTEKRDGSKLLFESWKYAGALPIDWQAVVSILNKQSCRKNGKGNRYVLTFRHQVLSLLHIVSQPGKVESPARGRMTVIAF